MTEWKALAGLCTGHVTHGFTASSLSKSRDTSLPKRQVTAGPPNASPVIARAAWVRFRTCHQGQSLGCKTLALLQDTAQ